MSGKRKYKKYLFITILGAGMCLMAFIGLHFLPTYFSITKKANANVLVVEGWLPPYAIAMSADIFRQGSYDVIVTTGLKPSDFYLMAMNGYLIFNVQHYFKDSTIRRRHLIETEVSGELSRENASHFNIFLNDSLAGSFLASRHKKKFSVEYTGKLSGIDSIMIQFDNDKHGKFGDRNLFVKGLIIDHTLTIPYQKNSIYDLEFRDGKRRMVNDFNSFADLARKRLLLNGIDSSNIIALPGKPVHINRTISSVLAFRTWCDTTNIEISGINIVTLGFHARRTYMTYKKVLHKEMCENIGVISLPDYKSQYSRKNRYYKLLHEFTGIIYYWIILNFYS